MKHLSFIFPLLCLTQSATMKTAERQGPPHVQMVTNLDNYFTHTKTPAITKGDYTRIGAFTLVAGKLGLEACDLFGFGLLVKVPVVATCAFLSAAWASTATDAGRFMRARRTLSTDKCIAMIATAQQKLGQFNQYTPDLDIAAQILGEQHFATQTYIQPLIALCGKDAN